MPIRLLLEGIQRMQELGPGPRPSPLAERLEQRGLQPPPTEIKKVGAGSPGRTGRGRDQWWRWSRSCGHIAPSEDCCTIRSWDVMHLRATSNFWSACSVWQFVWGWKPEVKLEEAPTTLQKAFQNWAENCGPQSDTISEGRPYRRKQGPSTQQFVWQRVDWVSLPTATLSCSAYAGSMMARLYCQGCLDRKRLWTQKQTQEQNDRIFNNNSNNKGSSSQAQAT